ncbi:lysophospholipid acyltransferase family protein [Lewinella sp. LCG006]|uniref:lysophospholipid acyltransferase family protein n=1 Tax=Lewinella sp. LCG006 TaxID=3231911 RepID=UPI00346072F7
MSRILYYLFLKPLSMLPLSVLYVFSTGLFYVLYYGAGYRKKVVMGNLRRSFPDKSEQEIKQIASNFYRHLCDLIFESVRMFSMGEEEIRRRAIVTNPEFVKELEAYDKGIVVIAGHYNSWEMMGTAFPMFSKLPVVALYSPIKDPFFSKVLSDSRGKYGLELVPKHEAKAMFKEWNGRPAIYLFGGDQSPTSSKKSFWMEFLNQDTAVAFGTEKFAKEYDCLVVFGDIQKVKRGYYTMTFSLISDKPLEEEHGAITIKHTRKLEEVIRAAPQYWLWTHKRWKRKREDG